MFTKDRRSNKKHYGSSQPHLRHISGDEGREWGKCFLGHEVCRCPLRRSKMASADRAYSKHRCREGYRGMFVLPAVCTRSFWNNADEKRADSFVRYASPQTGLTLRRVRMRIVCLLMSGHLPMQLHAPSCLYGCLFRVAVSQYQSRVENSKG